MLTIARASTLIVFGIAVWATAGCALEHGHSQAQKSGVGCSVQYAVTQARAFETALHLAEESGYDVDAYDICLQLVDGGWIVVFDMRPRSDRLIGFGDPYKFSVAVDARGSATLHRGK